MGEFGWGVATGISCSIVAALFFYASIKRDLPDSSVIKKNENYLEVVRGFDTLKYYKINDSTYCIGPKKFISQDKSNRLEEELK